MKSFWQFAERECYEELETRHNLENLALRDVQ